MQAAFNPTTECEMATRRYAEWPAQRAFPRYLRAYACSLLLPELPHFLRGLFQPVRHTRFAVHHRRSAEVLPIMAVGYAIIELAEAEVAVGDQRAHATGLGERESLTIVACRVLGATC